MKGYDFSTFENVEITGIDMDSLTDEERSILYVQAKYCQATEDKAVFDGGNDSEEKNENSKSGSYSAYGNRSWRMWKHR